MLMREEPVDLLLQIIRWGSSSESDTCNVFFVMVLQPFGKLGRLTNTYEKNSSSKRVKCAGVSHLQILLVEMLLGKRGYHIVYFVSHSNLTYRDYLVTQDLKADTISAWYDALLETMKPELLSDTYVNKALVLSQ